GAVIGLLLLCGAAAGAAPDASAFESWFAERGVTVQIARAPGPIPWIRGAGEVDASAANVATVLLDFFKYRQFMSPAIAGADVLESGAQTARLHMVWHYPFPLRNRDAIVRYRGEFRPDGTFHLAWQDEARPGDPSEGVRIARVAGETAVAPLGPD